MRSFKDYYIGTILRPRRTFDALMLDDRRLKFGLLALAINAFLYTLVYVFLTAIACLASLLHDLPDSFLGAIGVLDLRAYEVALNSPTIWRTILLTLYAISIIWFMVLFTKGVGAAQRIRGGPAALVGVLAYAVYQFVFVIFNR